ncbi:Zinc-binding dehydrogenase [Ceratobasidium sp. AG-Ba]|nr:Zinc-binding dehydrogenase [Ceratobasidium sp. AG-Ba]
MFDTPFTAKTWRFPLDANTWDGHKSLELRDVIVAPPQRGEILVKLHAASLNYRLTAFMICSSLKVVIPAPLVQVLMDEALSLHATELVRLSLLGKTWRNGRLETEYTRFSMRASSLVHPRTSISICLWAQGFRDVWLNTVLQIPHYQSYEETAVIRCAAVTAWNAFFEKKCVTKDSTVLVLNNGGASVVGAQFAKAAGDRVIATTSSSEKEGKYKALGIPEVINYRENPVWSETVKHLAGGKWVEQVL